MSVRGSLKVATILFLGLVLWVALIAVLGTISERSERREEVYREVTQTTAGSQVILGPILAIPYEVETSVSRANKNGTIKKSASTERRTKYIVPKKLKMVGHLEAQRRYRSLYDFIAYNQKLSLSGEFNYSELKAFEKVSETIVHWHEPQLLVFIQDSRGLLNLPTLRWNNNSLPISPGHGSELSAAGGFHAVLPRDVLHGGTYLFEVDLKLKGTQAFSWLAAGEESKIKITSNWPHPSFQGLSLPTSYSVRKDYFEAEWDSTHFSTNISSLLALHEGKGSLNLLEHGTGVKLIEPVDIYRQTERSVKYGFLFIALTFAAFLGFETLKRLAIHPVQYGFVGLALVLFYVLLLALSEHLRFPLAYGMATVSSLSLLGFYGRYVMHTWKRALVFTLALGILYGVIYGILLAEDYALLYGALLLFLLLGAAMIGTRRVDWHSVQFVR